MITADTVITAAAVITALGVITGAFAALCKWMERQKEQDEDIAQLKRENTLIVHALSACLDGLEQLGANHTVPKAKEMLNEYINEQAHR